MKAGEGGVWVSITLVKEISRVYGTRAPSVGSL